MLSNFISQQTETFEEPAFLVYQKINDSLRSEFGKRTVQEVVSGERGKIMEVVTQTANERAADLGMEILDLRLKKLTYPWKLALMYTSECVLSELA